MEADTNCNVDSTADFPVEEVEEDETEEMGSDCEQEEQHEFEIIDQVESEEDDGEDGKDEGNLQRAEKDGKDDFSSDTDVDDSELHAMLEKGIDKDSIGARKGDAADGGPMIKHKIVLVEFESDPFDILPEGWVCITHNSGMPVYLHKETRVCTMARPYYLGSASTRKHDIPISAIPCLQYRKQRDKAHQAGPEKPPDPTVKEAERKKSLSPAESENVCVNQLPSTDVSPRKMFYVTEESMNKCPVEEVLHTGKEDYAAQSNMEGCTDNRQPQSPGEGNIAVSLDSSSIVDPLTDGNNIASLQTSKPVDVKDKREHSSSDTDLKNVAESRVSQEMNSNSEGEVIEDSKVRDHNADSTSNSVDKHAPSVDMEKNIQVSQEDHASSHVVSEETSSCSVPSQLVTSGSAGPSSIKRKLENWKNKMHNSKLRKLDNGTALAPETGVDVDKPDANQDQFSTEGPCSDEKVLSHSAGVKIKTAEERAKESLLDTDTVHNYCTNLFKFKTIEVKKYRTWKERRRHLGEERNRNNRPELPSSTKLITCPIIGGSKPGTAVGGKRREFVLNPSGKSYLCILHEYMQRTLKIQPTYVFKELENSKTPYGATVLINTIEYGTGYASSKKMAKQEAAKQTLQILIPELSSKISDKELKHNVSDLSFFDEIKVTDPRVYDLGNKVGQPSPFQLLRECLRRNFGMGNTQCTVNTTAMKNQKCEFSIQVGKHSAKVVAKNKRDGKQLAAQAILAKLHPHVPSWGSLLRLYATNVEKPVEKVEEMNEIKTHVPNHGVLESLRQEMKKLHKQKEAIQSKGKMVISSKDLPLKVSGVDL